MKCRINKLLRRLYSACVHCFGEVKWLLSQIQKVRLVLLKHSERSWRKLHLRILMAAGASLVSLTYQVLRVQTGELNKNAKTRSLASQYQAGPGQITKDVQVSISPPRRSV